MILSLLTALTLTIQDDAWARLPEPVTNNAVAGVELDGQMMAYSFAGLHEGKTWRDVTADAYACNLTARTCREIDGLPDGIGRLASVAVTVRGQIYIFGGYTVAEDHSERSTPEVWRFDPASETYTHITDIPVPVDDTVALVHQDRYIYLVSGWHDTDNVDLIQIYDVEDDRWFEATPFPGAAVFGHAGAIIDQTMLICGGTQVVPPAIEGARRTFELSRECWYGQIDETGMDISWTTGPQDPALPRYRAALSVLSQPMGDEFITIGGSTNPYNYNGIGYDGEPSQPLETEVTSRSMTPLEEGLPWRVTPGKTTPVMDIRGVIRWAPDNDLTCGPVHLVSLGGMAENQSVTDMVLLRPGTDYCAE